MTWQGTDSTPCAAALTWKPPQMPTTSSVGRSHLQAGGTMPEASHLAPAQAGAFEDNSPSSADNSSLAQGSQATCCYFVRDLLSAVLPLAGPCTQTRTMIKQEHFCAGQQPDLRSRVVKPFSPTGPKAPNAFISAASSNGKPA